MWKTGGRLESGERQATAPKIVRYAEALGLQPGQLFHPPGSDSVEEMVAALPDDLRAQLMGIIAGLFPKSMTVDGPAGAASSASHFPFRWFSASFPGHVEQVGEQRLVELHRLADHAGQIGGDPRQRLLSGLAFAHAVHPALSVSRLQSP